MVIQTTGTAIKLISIDPQAFTEIGSDVETVHASIILWDAKPIVLAKPPQPGLKYWYTVTDSQGDVLYMGWDGSTIIVLYSIGPDGNTNLFATLNAQTASV